MGCGLPKLKRSEENSPGKIYSTLKRPQVQTKVGVAYTYHFLDFVLGDEDISGSPAPRLSSVRELPALLQDLYLQGFILAAVHPFVHPCGPDSVQQQLYRAVLIRHSDRSEKPQLQSNTHRLETEVCLSTGQLPDTDLIQGYVKKVQDVAEQGGFFVGFLHQPGAARCSPEPVESDAISLSLHSSPLSIQRELSGLSSSPEDPGTDVGTGGDGLAAELRSERTDIDIHSDHGEWSLDQDLDMLSTCNNNNRAKSPGGGTQRTRSALRHNRAELYALFNHLEVPPGLQQRYYSIKIPLQVQIQDGSICIVEAHWLDYMTQHFSSGAALVDGYFHLGDNKDLQTKSVESVFVFQEGDAGKPAAYDAIVVEQLSVVENLKVKTDYVPLLQSLAMYGWRLTCVMPTPTIKVQSDGSLLTKQIIFLQRPVLPRKKREPKRLSLRSRTGKNPPKNSPLKGNEMTGINMDADKKVRDKGNPQIEEVEKRDVLQTDRGLAWESEEGESDLTNNIGDNEATVGGANVEARQVSDESRSSSPEELG